MTRRLFLVLALAFIATPAVAQDAPPATDAATPTIDELLNGLETNLNFETRSARIRMTVANPRRTKVYEMQTYGRGLDESTIEFTEPARERGTRYLRRGDEMWMYLPSIERTQKISGHMLRQGMAGSDMSYEDMTSSTDWDEHYDGVIEGQEDVEGRPHWKIELTATTTEVTYARRVIWVDAETLIPTKQELYAISGMLVKRWEMNNVQELSDGRSYPMTMRIEDTLRDGTYTEIETYDIELGIELEEEVFSVRWLERG